MCLLPEPDEYVPRLSNIINIRFNIIIFSTLVFSEWSLFFKFLKQTSMPYIYPLVWQHRGYTFHQQIGTAKVIPLQALTGPEGSRKLRLPDFKIIGT
jgi:hypothetical protein